MAAAKEGRLLACPAGGISGAAQEDVMLDRRMFMAGAAGAAMLAALPLQAKKTRAFGSRRLADAIAALDRESGGRLGVSVLDKATGARFAWRGAERFAMCSTFKFPLSAATLYRVDRGLERLDRRVAVAKSDMVPNSPVTEKRVGGHATVAELCEATITLSDNAAANLLLAPLGGPAGFTRFMRAVGDPATRLDRTEPQMNGVLPGGDPRDTTTPDAMTDGIDRFLLGNVLKPASRAELLAWMNATKTGAGRIRAGVPSAWTLAHKTGTSGRGHYNDVGLIQPSGRAPILLSIYLADSTLESDPAEAILARATRAIVAEI
jgi:beta-lactamase class A